MLANPSPPPPPPPPLYYRTQDKKESILHPSMAVQAQYQSNLLLLDNKNRSKKENMEADYSHHHHHQLLQQQQYQQHQHHAFFFSNGDGDGGASDNNPKKRGRGRGRESQMGHQTHNAAATITLSQLHQPPPPPSVSTGLRLSFEDSSFSDELSAQINLHAQELDHFLLAQGEQLRRTLAEKRRGHYRALLAAAEDSAAKRIRVKEAELDRAARRTAELEDRLARLRTESMAWQAKAVADQAAAASLHAQIHKAAASAPAPSRPEECGESPAAEDAGSACTALARSGLCRSCRASPASVVLLPCRHLCLCTGCDAVTAGNCCPVCGSARAGSVPIFL